MIINERNILSTYKNPNWWNAVRCIEICKKRNWLLLSENSRLISKFAYMIGKVMGDGHLDRNFVARFSNDKRETLEKLKILINKDLHIPLNKMNILKVTSWGTSFCLIVYDSIFGRTLKTLGAPQGRKTIIKMNIPNWIYLSKETKKSFLQGILEDELANFKIKDGFPAVVNFKMTKNVELKENLIDFLKEVKNLLEEFDINCSKIKLYHNKFGTYEALFWIQRNAKNIIRFSENIGFGLNSNKIENLCIVTNLAREIVLRNG